MGPGIVPPDAVYAGDDWSRTFTFTQNGSPVDLVSAGWSGWQAQWRPSAGSTVDQQMTVDATNAATGVIVLSLSGVQTEAMGGPGVWDVQADVNGLTVTPLAGSFTWTQDVTR